MIKTMLKVNAQVKEYRRINKTEINNPIILVKRKLEDNGVYFLFLGL